MAQLGFPKDAVEVVQDLHKNARTQVHCNFGQTQDIMVRRGTIQGDSLSPFLFIVFMEPLLRWLNFGDGGYRCMSVADAQSHYANSFAVADDLGLASGSPQSMQRQLDKVTAFVDWAGMVLSPPKCLATGIMWGARAAGLVEEEEDWETLSPMLSGLRVAGRPLLTQKPSEPFRHLGALFCLNLDSKPGLDSLKLLVKDRGAAIAKSLGAIPQKLEMERSMILSTIEYHMAHAPFSMRQVKDLDRIRCRALKASLKIPNTSASDVLFLSREDLGCGLQSLEPLYAKECAAMLASTLNDTGRLGILSRALIACQLKRTKAGDLQSPAFYWQRTNDHMLLRQAAILTWGGLKLSCDLHASSITDFGSVYAAVSSMAGLRPLGISAPQVARHILHPLWRAGAYDLHDLLQDGEFRTVYDISRLHPEWSMSALKAYSLLTHACCGSGKLLHRMLEETEQLDSPATLRPCMSKSKLMQDNLRDIHSIPLKIECDHVTGVVQGPMTEMGLVAIFHACLASGPWRDVYTGPHLQPLTCTTISDVTDACAGDVRMAVVQPSLLHTLWPSKLAAFRAQQLQMRCELGFGSIQDCEKLNEVQAQAQSLLMALPMPPHCSSDHIHFAFQDIHPEEDVVSSGQAIIAHHQGGQISIHDITGRFLGTLPMPLLEKIEKLHMMDRQHSALLPQVLADFMVICWTIARRHDARKYLLEHQCVCESALLDQLMTYLGLHTHWLTSAVSSAPAAGAFAGCTPESILYGSVPDAYTVRWTGRGMITPPLSVDAAAKALEWAIASTYTNMPTLLFMIAHYPARAVKLKKLIQHPAVHVIAQVPAKRLAMHVPDVFTQHIHGQWPDSNMAPIMLIMIANAAGFQESSLTNEQWKNLGLILSDHNVELAMRRVHREGPMPRPPAPPGHSKAQDAPPHREALNPDAPRSHLHEIICQKPPKRWGHEVATYTDGSKLGSSLTLAWVCPMLGVQLAYRVPRPPSAQRTVMQAELLAIHAAVHAPHMQEGSLHILTDSLGSLRLIAAHIHRPQSLKHHKHGNLIAQIAQRLLSHPHEVYLSKVKSHSVVGGNQAADTLATLAHGDANLQSYTYANPNPRGRAWIQIEALGGWSDTDNLDSQLLNAVQKCFAKRCLSSNNAGRSEATKHVCKAKNSPGGLDIGPSTAFWSSPKLYDWDVSLILQTRYGSLPTNAMKAKWYPGATDKCPLCKHAVDTVPHRLGACSHTSVNTRVKLRHGSAVELIVHAVTLGCKGRNFILSDAECHDVRYKTLPHWMLPASIRHSRPDMVLLEGARMDDDGCVTSTNKASTLHLLEVTYTSDCALQDRVAVKRRQHAHLCQALTQQGWRDVRLHIFVIGHTGVMGAENADVLRNLGVLPARVQHALKDIAVMSCRQSCDILRAYKQASEPLELPSELPPTDNPDLDVLVPDEPSLLMPMAARRPDSDPTGELHAYAPAMSISSAARKRRRTKTALSHTTLPCLATPASVSFDQHKHSMLRRSARLAVKRSVRANQVPRMEMQPHDLPIASRLHAKRKMRQTGLPAPKRLRLMAIPALTVTSELQASGSMRDSAHTLNTDGGDPRLVYDPGGGLQ